MFHSQINRKKPHKPTSLRAISLILAIVCGCAGLLLIFNAFRRNGSGNVGWQLLIVNALAEMFLDTVARWYDNQEAS